MMAFVATLVAASTTGCKKTVTKPDPETERALEDCRARLKSKEDLISELQKQISDLKINPASGDVVVRIEGDVLTVTAGQGPNTRAAKPTGTSDDSKLYESFVASVRNSRGAIKKCYQNALKKNSALQARTVTLNITVNFKTNGEATASQFSPRISEHFDQCMEGIANRWKLPEFSGRAVSFQTKLSLTPE
jgi:hypothetical protein